MSYEKHNPDYTKKKIDEIFPKNVINQIENFKGKDVKYIQDKLIFPNLEAINKLTGQENSSLYLAYLVQYILNRMA